MTLEVYAYYENEAEEQVYISLPSHLAGLESTRKSFYGSTRVRKLGLKLLPLVEDQGQLWVQGAELQDLLCEVEVLLNHLALNEEEYWRFRLNNIKVAITEALKYGEKGIVNVG